jgi:hypothetical protein
VKVNIKDLENWEFGAVGIANPEISTLKRYFELIQVTNAVPGDIAEFGVSMGSSIITTGLLLNELNRKTIYGFDTFSGFPSYSEFDNFEMFNKLYKKNAITKNHFERVLKNKSYVLARGSNTEPKNISTSMDFSATSLEIVQSKIKYFALQDTIELIIGDFTKKLQEKLSNKTFSLVLIDSDLYESYAKILPVVWNKLTPGGYIYLDEYYSLKFPGPRIAVDSFVKNQKSTLVRLPDWMDFERWALHKPLNV